MTAHLQALKHQDLLCGNNHLFYGYQLHHFTDTGNFDGNRFAFFAVAKHKDIDVTEMYQNVMSL